MAKKSIRQLALILMLAALFAVFSPLISFSASTARNRAELVDLISEGIKSGQQTLRLTYQPGGLTEGFLTGAIEEAVGKNLRSICKVEGDTSKISGVYSDTAVLTFSYGKAKDYECFLAPALSDLYSIVTQSISAGRRRFAIYFPDERETQTLLTFAANLKQNLLFYKSAEIDEYFMNALYEYKAQPFKAYDSIGGFVLVCEFEYVETPEQTKAVFAEAARVVESLKLADKSLYEKVALINDYVIRYGSYLDNKKPESHSAYGFLKNKTAVCQGYALFTHALLTQAQLPCSFVSGHIVNPSGQRIDHLWNVVKTPAGWQHLDTTWNDVEGSAEEYLLRDAAFMKRDHFWDESILNDAAFDIKVANSLKKRGKIISLIVDDRYMNVGGLIREIDPGRGTKSLIVNDRTMLPIRSIIEAAGGSIIWNEEEKQVTINYKDYICDLWIGKKEAILNGIEIISDTAPQIINDRTMIPVRFVAESFGMGVRYDPDRREVTIIY